MPRTTPTAAERLTRELIHRFYGGDVDWLRHRFDATFSGIGAQPEQYRISVRDILINTGVMPDLVFVNEIYEEIIHTDQWVVVMGQYEAYTAPGQAMMLADLQRFTVIWRKGDDADLSDARLVHWHLSNPLRAATDNERFPGLAAASLLRSVSLVAEQKEYRREVRVRDVDGISHRFLLFDLMYVESRSHNSVIHLADGRVCVVHRGLGAFVEHAGLNKDMGFVRTHRCYVVNALYVRSVGDNLLLTNGECLPLPLRRHADVAADIESVRRGEAGSR